MEHLTLDNIFLWYSNHCFHDDSNYFKYFVCELAGITTSKNDLWLEKFGMAGNPWHIPDYKGNWNNIICNYDNYLKLIYADNKPYNPCARLVELETHKMDNLCNNEEGIRCYICDQLDFIACLSEITKGMPYDNIAGFEFLRTLVNTKVKLKEEFVLVNNDIKKEQYLLLPDPVIPSSTSDIKPFKMDNFRKSILCIVAYSLIGFLTSSSRKKLKKCQLCNKFYISKTNRRSNYCSNSCRMRFHNQERIKSGESKEYKRKKRKEGLYQ